MDELPKLQKEYIQIHKEFLINELKNELLTYLVMNIE